MTDLLFSCCLISLAASFMATLILLPLRHSLQGASGSDRQWSGKWLNELLIWWLWYRGDCRHPNMSGYNLHSCGLLFFNALPFFVLFQIVLVLGLCRLTVLFSWFYKKLSWVLGTFYFSCTVTTYFEYLKYCFLMKFCNFPPWLHLVNSFRVAVGFYMHVQRVIMILP